MKKSKWVEVSEATLKKTAAVIGSNSAAAQALAEAEVRRASGESVTFFRTGSSIVVRGEPATAAMDDDEKLLEAGFDTEQIQRWPNALTPCP